jgi:phytoene desaturase
MQKAAVIGAGFSGLSAATHLAHGGFDVTVYEKNILPGGRARQFEAAGFMFDMGPSWYWMPDVFEKYFNTFGRSATDFYQLHRLDPSYRIFFGKNDFIDIPAGVDALKKLFDSLEPGSSKALSQFLSEGKYKYNVGMGDMVYKPGLSPFELIDPKLIGGVFRLHLFQSIAKYIRKFFKEPRLIQLLEFPVLFLGATPEKTPALYSLMNYADMVLGTWYPMGGMYQIVDAMHKLAEEKGVQFQFKNPVHKLEMIGSEIRGVVSDRGSQNYDVVIAGADYHHVEQKLLPPPFRKYDAAYWNRRVLAPSSLLFYIGLNKKVKSLLHHTLFFDEDFALHAKEIYEDPQWPTAPQFYVSCPSQTDTTIAPEGHENIMILIPVAPGLQDEESIREKYFNLVINRLESLTGERIRGHIIYKRSYAHKDFISDYHAFKGNAYGLANTLWQTAHLKPSIINKKVSNLFYTGQLTVPGPGVPPSIISGEVVAQQVMKAASKIKSRKA